jgi:uncharacterized protein DUF4345
MFDRAPRIIVGLLALSGLAIGLWAAIDPHGFYRSFPGGGRTWVSADGPYNEHLVRDFGSLNLGLAAVALVAFWRPIRELLIAVGLANIVYGVPHLIYHLRHLGVYDTSDKVGNVLSLSAALVLPAILLAVALSANRSRGTAPA